MRDKGRAVLSALGYEGECRPDCFYCTDPDYGHPKPHPGATVVDLSDPGVFWPLFLEWIKVEDLQFFHESCWGEPPCTEPCHHFSIYKGSVPEPYSHGDGPRGGVTEAGINAWFSALSALGKIREG